MARRAVKVALFIMAALAAVAFSGVLEKQCTAEKAAPPPIASDEVVSPNEVPEWFRQEVVALDAAYDIRCASDGGVVGFSLSGSVDDVRERVSKELRQKGWVEVGSDTAELRTFTKNYGGCRWLALWCGEVAGEAVVVMQSDGAKGDGL